MAATGSLATLTSMPLGARLGLGQPDAGELGGDEDGVGHEPAGGDGVAAGEVRLEDAEVVPGGVGELRAAGDVTGGPDVVGGGAQVVVHRDEPAVGQLHAGDVEAEVGGDRRAAGGHQQLLAADLGAVVEGDDDVAVSGLAAHRLGACSQPDIDALAGEDRRPPAAATSGSSRGSSWSRPWSSVTRVPKMANIEANSQPT